MIAETALYLCMEISGSNYAQRRDVADLVRKLNADGIQISDYVKDPRFRIYKNLRAIAREERARELADPMHRKYMSEASLNDSADFMKEQGYFLKKAEKTFGIKGEYVTALLSMESEFGRKAGRLPAFNGLISFYLAKRGASKKEFYTHIKELVAFARENGIGDIFDIQGSYAGAVGVMQFLPGYLKRYAVDFDGDGFGLNDVPDGIGSCANLLMANGGRKNMARALYQYNHSNTFVRFVTRHAQALNAKSNLPAKRAAKKPPLNARKGKPVPVAR